MAVLFATLLLVHVLAVMVGVGTVTVTDYLHILGLRDPKLEKRTLSVFPHLSNLIRLALLIIYITGITLFWLKPELLQSTLFKIKVWLVIIVTVNGWWLHHKVFPLIEHGIKNDHYPPHLIQKAAFGGSLSVVSWYSIVILATTKTLGYKPWHFLTGYIIALFVAYFTALHIERRRRKKQEVKSAQKAVNKKEAKKKKRRRVK